MNQKLLIASTLVIAATFAISFAAVMDNQANAIRGDQTVAQEARNAQSALTLQRGLVNADVLDNTNVNLQANCAVNVLGDQC